MNVTALIIVCMLISATYKIVHTTLDYSSRTKVEEFPNCQICTTGIPYILWYEEDIIIPDMCHDHFKQSKNIDRLEKELLDTQPYDTRIVPIPGMEHELMTERADCVGRFRNTYINPLPIKARVLTSNDVREVEEMPYEEITVCDTGQVIRKVYNGTPDKPRAIAAPEKFSK